MVVEALVSKQVEHGFFYGLLHMIYVKCIGDRK